jgi:hypothetical protein
VTLQEQRHREVLPMCLLPSSSSAACIRRSSRWARFPAAERRSNFARRPSCMSACSPLSIMTPHAFAAKKECIVLSGMMWRQFASHFAVRVRYRIPQRDDRSRSMLAATRRTTPHKRLSSGAILADRSALDPQYAGSEWMLLKQRVCGGPPCRWPLLGRGQLGSSQKRNCAFTKMNA